MNLCCCSKYISNSWLFPGSYILISEAITARVVMLYFMIFTVAIGFMTTKDGSMAIIEINKQCNIRAISRQTSALKLKFYCLLELLIKTLTSEKVSPTDILAVLPQQISSKLRSEGATTINDIFRENAALDRELKWYSYSLLSQLIRNYGDNKCKEQLSNYTKFLRDYLRSRSAPNKETLSTLHGDNNATSQPTTPLKLPHIIVVDPEWDQELVGSESNAPEKDYIASLLNTTKNHIHFIPLHSIVT